MVDPSRRMLAGRDLAIDLGTATTLVYVRSSGVAPIEPSIAMSMRTVRCAEKRKTISPPPSASSTVDS